MYNKSVGEKRRMDWRFREHLEGKVKVRKSLGKAKKEI